MAADHVDVLIVGAGLSGIGAGHQLGQRFPSKSYAIIEARDDLGGTWSQFRYPGVRSDSDMHTLGYRWRPWTGGQAIADGAAILDYLRETAREGDVTGHIRFGQRVVRASWSTADATWTVEVLSVASGARTTLTCGFLFVCSGYFRYDHGFTPVLPHSERFRGPIVHPQQWPDDLDYTGKRVVVIGSGSTAFTLIPALARQAALVTMLQRSPSYVLSVGATDSLAERLRGRLPRSAAYAVIRWKNILRAMAVYQLARLAPQTSARILRHEVRRRLPDGFDVDRHFTPRYDPWDERLCFVPDGDFFRALRDGTADVVTDEIATVSETGLELVSGQRLDADIIVTATGLSVVMFGEMELTVDGERVEVAERMVYKGVMLSDVPNFAFGFGYTNASWTLKIDLTYDYVWRLLDHLAATGTDWCMPIGDPDVEALPFLAFQPGYIRRSLDDLPRSGATGPWRVRMNYLADRRTIARGDLEDGVLAFGTRQVVTASTS